MTQQLWLKSLNLFLEKENIKGPWKTLWEKEKMLVTLFFILFLQCFLLCQGQKVSFELDLFCRLQKSMGECNTILSAYTKYKHLG